VKILANENMSGAVVTTLRSNGHDVLWVLTDFPGAKDEAVLARAFSEQRLLITFDKDFGELVFAKGFAASDGVILFRISQPTPGEAARRISATIDSRQDWSGHFSVVDDTKIRMIPLPKATRP
jgi:predicted nuclease of predicted toxin-antitoxin system